jgi:DNA-3-methyladenine glycosylase II
MVELLSLPLDGKAGSAIHSIHDSRRPQPQTSLRSRRGIAHLRARDAKLAALIDRAGPFTLRLDPQPSPFESLLESILYQQLHGKAAATIHRRVREYFGGDPTPQLLLDTPDEPLRAAGVSGNKIKALRDLAARTLDGTVPSHAAIRKMSDADIVERLTEVRGIGSWTVEMLLIFRLGRPDVLPVTDYGVRKGFALTFQRVPKSRPLKPPTFPSPTSSSAAASAGRRTAPWPAGTCGGPAIWPKTPRPPGRSAR